MPPTESIRGAFQVGYSTPTRPEDAWGDSWRCDHAVLTPVNDPARATWTAQVMDRIRPDGVVVPRQLRSTDGRYAMGGWTARSFVSGHRAPRFDEVAAAALRLNAALVGEPRPAFLSTAPSGVAPRAGVLGDADLFAAAENAAWADDPTEQLGAVMDASAVPREDVAAAMAKAAALIPLRAPVAAPDQLVHGDMLGCTVFDGSADPAVVDLVPAWRPTGWSVALTVVDAVAWSGAEDELFDRWSHLPDFTQLLLRAVIYRLFVHAVLPDSRPEAWPGLERVSDIVKVRVSGRSDRSGADDRIGEDVGGSTGGDGTGQETGREHDGLDGLDGQDGQDGHSGGEGADGRD
ncbi:hypothetical protein A606_08615 [Corynebacterium terpenotabidum Y-11]|uniref:TIGR02569 family protein n=1 Tax=Corynebacterium terpenotabidum Y-11 TaxID=1200352 RepID=S4XFN0_9CORY|nr:hypothetical protein A606_08615 [Corynebacterium terpenotabidum Y-11]